MRGRRGAQERAVGIVVGIAIAFVLRGVCRFHWGGGASCAVEMEINVKCWGTSGSQHRPSSTYAEMGRRNWAATTSEIHVQWNIWILEVSAYNRF